MSKTLKINPFYLTLLIIFSFTNEISLGQNTINLRLIVKDSASQLPIKDVYVVVNSSLGQSTNYSGYSQFNVPKGEAVISFFHVSYNLSKQIIKIESDTLIEFYISKVDLILKEAVVVGKRPIHISNGKIEVSGNLIRKSPSMLATADPLRYLQTMSGVTFVSDAFSGIHVRGGGFDQTWVRIDGAPVYNSTHFFGFSSVLNSSATQSLSLYKSNLPGDFGTRGSALLDVTLQPGSLQKTTAEFEIGLLNSGLSFSTPIVKDKVSFSSHFRSGYPFFVASLFADELDGVSLYYYDWCNKLHFKLKNNRTLNFTVINYADKFAGAGLDFFGNSQIFMGNAQSWNSLSTIANYSGLRKKNGTFQINGGYSFYKSKDFNQIINNFDPDDPILETFSKSGNTQSYYSNGTWTGLAFKSFKTEFGYNLELINNKPFQFQAYSLTDQMREYNSEHQRLLNTGLFYFLEKNLSTRTKLKFGNRINVIPFRNTTSSLPFVVNEPRVNIQYITKKDLTFNLSYERSSQVQHVISPNLVNVVTDFWFLANETFTPQIANQYAAGAAYKWSKHSINAEVYFKPINNIPDFKENTSLLNDNDFFDMIVQVKSRNYGIELDHGYYGKKLTWRNSLSLSKSQRIHPEINEGKWYNSNYDIPVKFNSNISFKLNKKWEFTANFIIQSGRPFTHYYYPYWRSDINEFRYPVYHRADVAFYYHKPVKPNSKTSHSWNLSIFNVYNRLNPTYLFFENGRMQGYSLFPIIPSFNYILKIR